MSPLGQAARIAGYCGGALSIVAMLIVRLSQASDSWYALAGLGLVAFVVGRAVESRERDREAHSAVARERDHDE